MILEENGGGMATSDLRLLIETRIPEHRGILESSYDNLENVARYCEGNYADAADKNVAFEDTKRLALQSLASVAYHINTLARDLLDMLELQTDKVGNMANQVDTLNTMVNLHNERIARREIGMLTTSKMLTKQSKIIVPAVQEPVARYKRTPIDYNVLDGVGHGARPIEPVAPRQTMVSRAASTVSTNQNAYGAYGQYERTANINNTLSRASMRTALRGGDLPDHYRVPQVMPLLDSSRVSSQYGSSGERDHYQHDPHLTLSSTPTSHSNYQGPGSDYGSLTGDRYGTIRQSIRTSHEHANSPGGLPMPAPPLSAHTEYGTLRASNNGLPPPPAALLSSMHADIPLPPPPMAIVQQNNFFDAQPDWIPHIYIEKAVAIYDYDADKPDELSLRENSIVYVVKKNEDGWYEGVLDGATGLFPGNYVQSID